MHEGAHLSSQVAGQEDSPGRQVPVLHTVRVEAPHACRHVLGDGQARPERSRGNVFDLLMKTMEAKSRESIGGGGVGGGNCTTGNFQKTPRHSPKPAEARNTRKGNIYIIRRRLVLGSRLFHVLQDEQQAPERQTAVHGSFEGANCVCAS